jgi:hypothetical protein
MTIWATPTRAWANRGRALVTPPGRLAARSTRAAVARSSSSTQAVEVAHPAGDPLPTRLSRIPGRSPRCIRAAAAAPDRRPAAGPMWASPLLACLRIRTDRGPGARHP